MSVQPCNEPACQQAASSDIETIIEGQPRDIGALVVRRVLPSSARRAVGPFVFFDHVGPAELPVGRGIDVRPHPHIGLATVTYLFEGELVHKDSLGSDQAIRPGAINWMTAGRGIVHSERTSPEQRVRGPHVHGIQLWIGLPKQHEHAEPSFTHHPADTLPQLEQGAASLRVLAGRAYGVASPVRVFSPLCYVEAVVPRGVELELPTEYSERAAYVVEGIVTCGEQRVEAPRMLVFARSAAHRLRAEVDARLMLLGGEPLDGTRYLWWNFVASSKGRMEQAKRDWKAGRFPKVPGDESEFIPLPE